MSATRGVSTRREDFAGRTENETFYNPAILDGVQKVGNKANQGQMYCNIGDDYYNLGDFKEALNYHELYLNTVSLGDRAGHGCACGKLGEDHHGLENFEQAIYYHEQHLQITLETGNRNEEGRVCENLGNACYSMGDFKSAIKWYKRELDVAEEIGDKTKIGKASRNLGNSYFHDGAFEDAITHHSRDLSIAKELGDKAGEGIAYGNLGNLYLNLGFSDKAIKCQELNLIIAKEVKDSAEEGNASYLLGCSLESKGSLDEALNCFQTSLNIFEDIRSRGQLKDECKINVQNEYKLVIIAVCRILLKQNKIQKALAVAEKGRAQVLKDLMKSKYESETGQSDADTEDNVAADMQLSSDSVLLPINSDEDRTSEHEFETNRSFLDRQESIVGNVLSNLSSTTLFLAIDKNEINIWVLKRNEVHFRKGEIGSRQLEEDVVLSFSSLRQAAYPLTEDEINSMTATSAEAEHTRHQRALLMSKALRIWHEVVISPVADLLEGLEGDELVIVPDGPLCVTPFAAFMDPSSRYLCESFRVRVVPSLTSLKLIADSAEYHSKKGVLLVGNPCLEEIVTPEPWNWYLPKAEEEVKSIGEILNSKPLIGKAATKEEVLKRLTSVTLVHIAAQGSDENGEILLTPNPSRPSQEPEMHDYLLTIADVIAIQLRARLVVLSSCHSAQGKIKLEGAVGIARAFLAAGARCVLVSLWENSDEATLKFMKSFYEHLMAGERASVALNQAMKYLKESTEFCGVEHWAAFQLIGDDVTLEFEDQE